MILNSSDNFSVSAVKHYDLAKLAIQNNKHVFVETPHIKVPHAEETGSAFVKKQRKINVGHLMEYHRQ